ncbi:DMT family transporter [Aestuariispira ectoiniformans]|uniref:DMT family transporter n=1 Tax=Aestuariispira ectoiniformans TaxID=2775080 RepID=UPI00223C0450|nr:DMT family transporter [Aestuariispira ectoiniformans]
MLQSSVISERNNLQAIIYLVVGIFSLSMMDATAKWLVHANYEVVQILAVRGWIVTAILLVYAVFNGGLRKQLYTKRLRDHAVRTAFAYLAPFCFFTSLQTLPLADATVIFFAAPFIMTALSVPLFKEKVGLHRWAAIVIGFIGVLVALQPGSDGFHPMALVVVVGCVFYAVTTLAVRWLGSTESTFKIVFYFNFGVALISTIFAPFVWVPMTLLDIGVVAGMAGLALCGHVFVSRAFNTGQVGVIAPFEYSALLWTTIIGFLIWDDLPSSQVWSGAVIIIGSGLYIIHRERRQKKAATPAKRPA